MFDCAAEKTALVVVDMQNDFVREGAGMEVPQARDTIRANQKLISFARSKAMPVVFTKFMAGPKESILWNWSPQIRSCGACKRNAVRYYPDVKKELSCTDIIDELYPQKGDYIVEKYWYSSFRNTNLIDILRSEDRDTVIVTGTVTQICVEDTVHDAFTNGLKAIVASDAVSSFAQALAEAALENITMKYGVVLATDEIIAAYSR